MLLKINSQHTGRQIGEINVEELIKEVSAKSKMKFENIHEFAIYKGPNGVFRFYSTPGCPPQDEKFFFYANTNYSNGKLYLPEEIVAACTTKNKSMAAVEGFIESKHGYYWSIVVSLDVELSRMINHQ